MRFFSGNMKFKKNMNSNINREVHKLKKKNEYHFRKKVHFQKNANPPSSHVLKRKLN